jgi:hypothetical protein
MDTIKIPKQNPAYVGTGNPNNKYSEDTIHKVCGYLQDRPDLSHAQIGILTRTNRTLVRNLKRRAIWHFITSQYKY